LPHTHPNANANANAPAATAASNQSLADAAYALDNTQPDAALTPIRTRAAAATRDILRQVVSGQGRYVEDTADAAEAERADDAPAPSGSSSVPGLGAYHDAGTSSSGPFASFGSQLGDRDRQDLPLFVDTLEAEAQTDLTIGRMDKLISRSLEAKRLKAEADRLSESLQAATTLAESAQAAAQAAEGSVVVALPEAPDASEAFAGIDVAALTWTGSAHSSKSGQALVSRLLLVISGLERALAVSRAEHRASLTAAHARAAASDAYSSAALAAAQSDAASAIAQTRRQADERVASIRADTDAAMALLEHRLAVEADRALSEPEEATLAEVEALRELKAVHDARISALAAANAELRREVEEALGRAEQAEATLAGATAAYTVADPADTAGGEDYQTARERRLATELRRARAEMEQAGAVSSRQLDELRRTVASLQDRLPTVDPAFLSAAGSPSSTAAGPSPSPSQLLEPVSEMIKRHVKSEESARLRREVERLTHANAFLRSRSVLASSRNTAIAAGLAAAEAEAPLPPGPAEDEALLEWTAMLPVIEEAAVVVPPAYSATAAAHAPRHVSGILSTADALPLSVDAYAGAGFDARAGRALALLRSVARSVDGSSQLAASGDATRLGHAPEFASPEMPPTVSGALSELEQTVWEVSCVEAVATERLRLAGDAIRLQARLCAAARATAESRAARALSDARSEVAVSRAVLFREQDQASAAHADEACKLEVALQELRDVKDDLADARQQAEAARERARKNDKIRTAELRTRVSQARKAEQTFRLREGLWRSLVETQRTFVRVTEELVRVPPGSESEVRRLAAEREALDSEAAALIERINASYRQPDDAEAASSSAADTESPVLDALRHDYDQLAAELDEARTSASKLARKNRELSAQSQSLAAELAKLRTRLTAESAARGDAEAAYAQRVASLELHAAGLQEVIDMGIVRAAAANQLPKASDLLSPGRKAEATPSSVLVSSPARSLRATIGADAPPERVSSLLASSAVLGASGVRDMGTHESPSSSLAFATPASPDAYGAQADSAGSLSSRSPSPVPVELPVELQSGARARSAATTTPMPRARVPAVVISATEADAETRSWRPNAPGVRSFLSPSTSDAARAPENALSPSTALP
jgi:hypothetical protein